MANTYNDFVITLDNTSFRVIALAKKFKSKSDPMSFRYYFDNEILYIHCGNLPKADVVKFINKRKDDILAKYEEHQNIRNRIYRLRDFVDGEKVSILGSPAILRVNKSDVNSVDLTQDELILNVTDPTDKMLCRKVYEDWKAERLTEVVNMLTPDLYARVDKLMAPIPREVICTNKLSYRYAGYCSSRCDSEGHINYTVRLHTKLLELPLETINAVFAHELAHTSYMDHGKGFHSVLTELCPGWGYWDKFTFEKWYAGY